MECHINIYLLQKLLLLYVMPEAVNIFSLSSNVCLRVSELHNEHAIA